MSYVEGGILVPPKDLMFKHDPDYKNPDLDPDDPEAKKEKPPKIYYYKKGAIAEYYRNSGRYITQENQTQQNTTYYNNYNNQDNPISTQTEKKSNFNIYLFIVLIFLILSISSIILKIYSLKQAQTIPVYEKYSTKLPRRKRETIFDKVK